MDFHVLPVRERKESVHKGCERETMREIERTFYSDTTFVTNLMHESIKIPRVPSPHVTDEFHNLNVHLTNGCIRCVENCYFHI